MRIAAFAFVSILLVFPLVFAEEDINQVADNFQVTYRTSCNADETCLFSIDNLTNAHVAECGNFTYKACATKIGTAGIRTSCLSGETELFTISALDGSAHVEAYFDPFAYRVCAKPATGNFACSYATSPPGDKYKCVVSLSNQSNAHVNDCTTDPFANKIYCRAQLEVPEQHTVQVKITVKSTADSAYIPGTGKKSFSSIETKDYFPSSSYIASENTAKNLVYAVIGASGKATTASTLKTSADYGIKLEQEQTSNKIYLVFTRSPLPIVQDRSEQLFDGTEIENFGYALEEVFNILVGLDYGESILVSNNETVYPGKYTLVVRVKDQTSVAEVVEVRTR